MSKPIEPGCICVLQGMPAYTKMDGSIVEVLYKISSDKVKLDPQYAHMKDYTFWLVMSSKIRSICKTKRKKDGMVVAEPSLKRIDDGDYEPEYDGTDLDVQQDIPAIVEL